MGKLVRDKIDDKIRTNGEIPITRILSLDEYRFELLKKLDEELLELKEAITLEDKMKILEESTDLFEVIFSYNELVGNSLGDIITFREKKRDERGGFSRRLYLERVINKE